MVMVVLGEMFYKLCVLVANILVIKNIVSRFFFKIFMYYGGSWDFYGFKMINIIINMLGICYVSVVWFW